MAPLTRRDRSLALRILFILLTVLAVVLGVACNGILGAELGELNSDGGGIDLGDTGASSSGANGGDGSVTSTSKDITQFSINGVSGTINGTNITLTLPFGTDVTNLTPTIAHTGKSISPASGAAQNFSSAVTYTVTAIDNSTKAYSVLVSTAPSGAKDITKFTINNVNAAITGTSISLTLPSGANVTNLSPVITITGASVLPASGSPTNFTNPVTYTVTAADGTTKAYTATVNIASPSDKEITEFSINGVNGAIAGTSISLTLPSGTPSLTNLTPLITITGASVSPASGVAQDFTNPVTYTVTAADSSTKVYTVSVTIATSNAKDITAFSILGVNGTIAGQSIALTVPSGSPIASLTPTIAITGTSVSPASGVPQNFTNAVPYTVTAADGSTKVYTVTVTVAASGAKDITSFAINGVSGTIGTDTIAITLPSTATPQSLTPVIAITGASVSPGSGTTTNFTNPVVYTVTAADGTTKAYTVTVTIAQSSEKDITAFSIQGYAGTIVGQNIGVTLPSGSPVNPLSPIISITGVSVSPGSGVPRDFSGSVIYTVTAQDGSTKAYTVTVTVAASSTKDITKFTILNKDGTIGANSISLNLPPGTDKTQLIPTTITITGVSVNPAAGAVQNFTSPVNYTVTAADGSTKVYAVTVTVDPDITGPTVGACSVSPANGVHTSSNAASATFSGSTDSVSPPVTYQCSKDGAAYADCISVYNTTVVGVGAHSLAVRAHDAVNNITAQCSSSWTFDNVGPTTSTCSITPANGASTTSTAVSATFSGATDALSPPITYQCSKDGGAFATCASVYNSTVVGLGSHSLTVRAIDSAGPVPNATIQCTSTWTVTSPGCTSDPGGTKILAGNTYNTNYYIVSITNTGAPCGVYTFPDPVLSSGCGGGCATVTPKRDGVNIPALVYNWQFTIGNPTPEFTFSFPGYFDIKVRKAGTGTINLYGMASVGGTYPGAPFDGIKYIYVP